MSLEISKEYAEIAEKIIDKFNEAFSMVDTNQILFLSETEKSPAKYADIRAIKPPYTFITNYKFIITFYEPKLIAFTSAQKEILVLHELRHINDDFDGLVKHNVEDFSDILAKYGVDWDVNGNVKSPLED